MITMRDLLFVKKINKVKRFTILTNINKDCYDDKCFTIIDGDKLRPLIDHLTLQELEEISGNLVEFISEVNRCDNG